MSKAMNDTSVLVRRQMNCLPIRQILKAALADSPYNYATFPLHKIGYQDKSTFYRLLNSHELDMVKLLQVAVVLNQRVLTWRLNHLQTAKITLSTFAQPQAFSADIMFQLSFTVRNQRLITYQYQALGFNAKATADHFLRRSKVKPLHNVYWLMQELQLSEFQSSGIKIELLK
jgi:hypothetical protein